MPGADLHDPPHWAFFASARSEVALRRFYARRQFLPGAMEASKAEEDLDAAIDPGDGEGDRSMKGSRAKRKHRAAPCENCRYVLPLPPLSPGPT